MLFQKIPIINDVNEKRNLDMYIGLSSRSSNHEFLLSTKVSAFSPIVYIGQSVHNIFHASRMIVSVMCLYGYRI